MADDDAYVRDNSQPLWQLLFLENWLEHAHDSTRRLNSKKQLA
jgi:hypothetical protein